MKILKNRKIGSGLVALILLLFAYLAWPHQKAAAPSPVNPNPSATTVGSASFNKQQYSLTDPTSIWVIVNKKHPLNPISYAPADLVVASVPLRAPGNESMQLRQPAAQALEQMFAAAKTANLNLQISSGYRSYTYQVNLYNSYVKADGQAQADQESARPGYSEHQTGLAVDIEPTSRACELQTCFANTPEGQWLAANSYIYGFILRYTVGGQSVTGYESEPWHFRYVGAALAYQMRKDDIPTLEQFFGVGGGPSY